VEECARFGAAGFIGTPALALSTRREDGEEAAVSRAAGEAFVSKSDEALVGLAKDGDRDAFEELVRRHQRTVYQVCFRYSGRHEEAADLAQETLVRAWRSLGSFRGDARFSTWLYRVAANTALARAPKARTAEVPLEQGPRLASREEPPDAALERAERERDVRAAIAQLPSRQRTTLILRMYHDLTHEQIAAVMGGSVGTAKANLFHALRKLRTLLTKESGS